MMSSSPSLLFAKVAIGKTPEIEVRLRKATILGMSDPGRAVDGIRPVNFVKPQITRSDLCAQLTNLRLGLRFHADWAPDRKHAQ